MTELELINVDNGNSDYPGSFTKKEQNIISEFCFGYVINLFSGKSEIGNMRIDLACKEANINADVFSYLENLKIRLEGINTVILDPPYNERFALKYHKLSGKEQNEQFVIFANAKKTTKLFELIKEKLNPERIIMKSWNYYVPKGYSLKKGYVCYAGGYRKPTILLIMDRID